MDDPNIHEAAQEAYSVVVTLVAVVIGVVAALVASVLLRVIVRRIGRRSEFARDMSLRMRRSARAVLIVIGTIVAVQVSVPDDRSAPWWRDPLLHLLFIALIAVGAWLVGTFAFVLEDRMLARYSGHGQAGADDRHVRRVRTQVTVIRRLTVAILVLCAVAGILMTFPAARAAGASLFASAGLLSIVAGLAAQTSLANVFAGMQIAFTDAIRQEDIVVLQGEWGRIEEITMTYVVVHLWDDRRLILPSTYFTTTPFENWTRRQSELLGTVELDLDWEVPVGRMRGALKELLADTDLWDDRVGILQVTDATDGHVQVRALVSAHDAPTLFDLRCYVREGLVDWLQKDAPEALPRLRLGDAVERPVEIPGRWQASAEKPVAAQAEEQATTPATKDSDDDGPDAAVASPPSGGASDQGGAAAGPHRLGTLHVPGATGGPERSSWRRRSFRRPALPAAVTAPDAGEGVADGVVGTSRPVRPTPSDDATVVLTSLGTITPAERPAQETSTASESALFSGTREGVERSKAFAGPGQEVYDEREETAERAAVGDDGVDPDGDGTPDESAGAEAEREDPAARSARAPRGGDVTGNEGDGPAGDGGHGGHGDGGGDY